jgi:phytoene dehydrogenase-like protein
VRLADGEVVEAETVLSTAGIPETIRLSGWSASAQSYIGRMSFMETVALVPQAQTAALTQDRTIVFYHKGPQLQYQRPGDYLDTSWGVICFPGNFTGLPPTDPVQIRMTNAANYPLWKQLAPETYAQVKQQWTEAAITASEEIIGNYRRSVVYQDSFTPVTIERFTRKAEGAVYGSGIKIKDGATPWPNLYLAGTDQGYLGIVGSMLSGITIVNQHILR